jgi:hypothetical protein
MAEEHGDEKENMSQEQRDRTTLRYSRFHVQIFLSMNKGKGVTGGGAQSKNL